MLFGKARFLYHMLKFAKDPTNTPEVFRLMDTLRESLTPEEAKQIGDEFLKDPSFKALFDSKNPDYLSKPYDLKALLQCAPHTLGYQYARMLSDRGFDPEFFAYVKVKNALDYFAVRLRKTHDIWHTLTGFNTDVAGELGLQAFYLSQVPSPVPMAILSSGILHVIGLKDVAMIPVTFDQIVAGYEMGKQAKKLFGIAWEDHWHTDLNELRRMLQVRAIRDTLVAA